MGSRYVFFQGLGCGWHRLKGLRALICMSASDSVHDMGGRAVAGLVDSRTSQLHDHMSSSLFRPL